MERKVASLLFSRISTSSSRFKMVDDGCRNPQRHKDCPPGLMYSEAADRCAKQRRGSNRQKTPEIVIKG